MSVDVSVDSIQYRSIHQTIYRPKFSDVSVDMYRSIQFGQYTLTYKVDSIISKSVNMPISSAHQGYLTQYRSFMGN